MTEKGLALIFVTAGSARRAEGLAKAFFAIMREWIESFQELIFWWSIWSLGDVYLLKYTPWSEFAALTALVVHLKILPWAKGRYRDWREKTLIPAVDRL
jgi:hypothetical protein